MNKRSFRLLLGLALVCIAGRSGAEDDYVKKEAQQRFVEAAGLMADGKYEPARAKLLQAYGSYRAPNVVFNLARCEHLTGRYVEAARHYREYLRMADPKKVSTREREDIEGWQKELGRYVGRIDIMAPAGSHVLVDDERIGDGPIVEPIDVTPGRHRVIAEANGRRLSADVDADAGTLTKVTLSEESTPVSIAPVTSGTQGSDAVTLPPRESERAPWSTTKTLGTAAWVGAVAAGVAGGLLLDASGERADEGRQATAGIPTCTGETLLLACAEAKDAAASSAQLKTGGVIAIGGAVALAATGFVLFFWPEPRQRSAMRPTLFVRGTGLGLIQQF